MTEYLENNAWVFDSLVGFLHGPVWNVPLQTFIEEKSLPFEPTDEGQVVDRPEYKKIHDEYRNLVDVMLGSFMDDIGITGDQFQVACHISAHDLAGLPAYFHKRLFEQIWAANDYDMFVKMMTHKNVELQLQALELYEQKHATMPTVFTAEQDLDTSQNDESLEWPDNDDVMTEIKKLQLVDIEVEHDEAMPADLPEKFVAEKKTLLSKLRSFKEEDDLKQDSFSHVEFSIKESKPPAPKIEVTEEEIRLRQEYLKQQRDKLLALKKQVREKRLGAVDSGPEGDISQETVHRPRSAKIAKAALDGTTPPPPPDAMHLRRALASKLKAEVVDTNLKASSQRT